MTDAFPPQYEPHAVEDKWIEYWRAHKTFEPRLEAGAANYSIVIPPPNVTGSLHMGHALNSTLQDILTRYHRMKGENVLWVVGTDHAGIATQNVVEKQLAAEGKKRDDLGREKFIERVWEWKKESGGTIIGQLKRLGASCDFDNERFTMDEGLSRAVKKVFVELYQQGLIYRGKRLINWCPRCHTALSDLEVEHESKKGSLWHIRYPLIASRGASRGAPTDSIQYIVVATTRPETLFGDVAVAVHPEDERYQDLTGAFLTLPLSGRNIPLITDTSVDRIFGTGAVKITPAHDFNDYATGERHQLAQINIFDASAKLNDSVPEAYRGLDRFKARDKAVQELEAAGLLEKIDEHTLSVGHCYRCKTVVEPYLSDQWFVKAKPLAEKAMQAVRSGQTRFVPEHWAKTYFQWMENIQDWCISRQIWWGHQIPAWYCTKSSCPPLVADGAPSECPKCGGKNLVQDPDVLDTWFSSALWPFSTLGWPEATPRLKTFYPTSVLVTAFDIIFFWVARMMMMGCHFMETVPFKDVYIHALVRDPTGQKMSKSKGNVVDPLIMMHKYGTDAFRFTLAAFAAQGRDIKLDEQRIEGYRAFCNKIWNAARFGQMMAAEHRASGEFDPNSAAHPFNRWILGHLQALNQAIPQHIEAYEFNLAALKLYTFFWNQYCDWYIEFIKLVFKDGTPAEKTETAGTFFFVLDSALKMLHPFMPFITEEIHAIVRQSGNTDGACLSLAEFPELRLTTIAVRDADLVDETAAIITAVRSIRQDTGLKSNVPLKILLRPTDIKKDELTRFAATIQQLAKVEAIEFTETDPVEAAALGIAPNTQVYIPLLGLIDIEAERQRLSKKREKTSKAREGLAARLMRDDFVKNAPPELVEEEKGQLERLGVEIAMIDRSLALLD